MLFLEKIQMGNNIIEKIKANLQAMDYMLDIVEQVRKELEPVKDESLVSKIYQDKVEFLQEIEVKLNDLSNDIGDYLNGQDMVMEEDEEFLAPLFLKINSESNGK